VITVIFENLNFTR